MSEATATTTRATGPLGPWASGLDGDGSIGTLGPRAQGPLGPWVPGPGSIGTLGPWPRVHWDPWSQAQGPLGPWVPGPGSIGTLGPLGPVATATMEGFVWYLGRISIKNRLDRERGSPNPGKYQKNMFWVKNKVILGTNDEFWIFKTSGIQCT